MVSEILQRKQFLPYSVTQNLGKSIQYRQMCLHTFLQKKQYINFQISQTMNELHINTSTEFMNRVLYSITKFVQKGMVEPTH